MLVVGKGAGVGWGYGLGSGDGWREERGERREERIVGSNVMSKLLTFICPPLNSVGDWAIF